jgi:hypothetical protein
MAAGSTFRAFFVRRKCCPNFLEGSGQRQRSYFQPPSLFFEGVVGVGSQDRERRKEHDHLGEHETHTDGPPCGG